MAKERTPPPPLPSAALLKLKYRQAVQKMGAGAKQKSTATVALSCLELIPGALGPRTNKTDPQRASTRPTPEVTRLWPVPPTDLRPPNSHFTAC